MPPHTFHIKINRRPFETHESKLTGLQILNLAGYGDEYELFELHGEGDPSGGQPRPLDAVIEIHEGQHFRAIPKDANFGFQSSGAPDLDTDVARLAEEYDVELLQDGMLVGVVLRGVPLPAGYNKDSCDLMVQTTIQYPASAMDMLWVDEDLLLTGGAVPQSGESMEGHFGRTWRRFSWHRNSPWVPGRDDLGGHIEFCLARLQQAR